jgi:hypothetical protein
MNDQQIYDVAEFILSFDIFVIEVLSENYDYEIDGVYYKKMSLEDALECKESFFELDENLKLTHCDNEILQMRLDECVENLRNTFN